MLLLLCLVAGVVHAQRTRLLISKFELVEGDLRAVKEGVKDYNGHVCPLVIVKAVGEKGIVDDLSFEGEVVKGPIYHENSGEYWLFLSAEAVDLRIASRSYLVDPLNMEEKFPEGLQEKMTYYIELQPAETKLTSSFTLGLGFNAMSMMGPTLSLGFMSKNFVMEVGGTYGLMSKTDNIYINDANGVVDGYTYQPIRGFLRLGYDVKLGSPNKATMALTPQIGAAFTIFQGSRISDLPVSTSTEVLNGANAISASLGLRLMFSPGGFKKAFRMYVTGEYDMAVSKKGNYTLLSNWDSDVKSWAEGLNVNAGIIFYFGKAK